MAAAGVEAVDCVSVDNALVLPADPLFAGFCWTSGAATGGCYQGACLLAPAASNAHFVHMTWAHSQ